MNAPTELKMCDLLFLGRDPAVEVLRITSEGRWFMPDGEEVFLHAATCQRQGGDCCRGRETQKKIAKYLGWGEWLTTTASP